MYAYNQNLSKDNNNNIVCTIKICLRTKIIILCLLLVVATQITCIWSLDHTSLPICMLYDIDVSFGSKHKTIMEYTDVLLSIRNWKRNMRWDPINYDYFEINN